jgi:hypothetical protein
VRADPASACKLLDLGRKGLFLPILKGGKDADSMRCYHFSRVLFRFRACPGGGRCSRLWLWSMANRNLFVFFLMIEELASAFVKGREAREG